MILIDAFFMSESDNNIKIPGNKKKKQSLRLSLGVHAMPKTSEKNFKSWFLIGGMMFFILVIIFLFFVI